jgi:hypothetical protein
MSCEQLADDPDSFAPRLSTEAACEQGISLMKFIFGAAAGELW